MSMRPPLRIVIAVAVVIAGCSSGDGQTTVSSTQPLPPTIQSDGDSPAPMTTTVVDEPDDQPFIKLESRSDAADQPNACLPSLQVPQSIPLDGKRDLRVETIVQMITGHRSGSFAAEDHPGFGGVWGDFRGGLVVAVLDCDSVDADALAEVAGGRGRLRLIEVPHTFTQVDGFRDTLVAELDAFGVEAWVVIDATLDGRMITIQLDAPVELPIDFAPSVPVAAYRVVAPEPTIPPEDLVEDDPLVDCVMPSRYSTLAALTPASSSDEAYLALQAWDSERGAETGIAEVEGWLIFHRERDRAVFGTLERAADGSIDAMAAQMERDTAGWRWSGSGGGPCTLQVVLPSPYVHVVWEPANPFTPDMTTLRFRVREASCQNPDFDERLQDAVVLERDDIVQLAFVATDHEEFSCGLGDAWTEVSVELSDPLGSRTVVDAFVVPDIDL